MSTILESIVDWDTYARSYDMLFEHNPAYQDLIRLALEEVSKAKIRNSGRLIDVGAGTGNFAVNLARLRPDLNITLLEPASEMIAIAHEKTERLGLGNISFVNSRLETFVTAYPFDVVTCTHVLYTRPDPSKAIETLRHLLRPSGRLIAIDLGRVLDIRDWTRYLWGHLKTRHGAIKALRIMWRGRHLRSTNKRIRSLQRSGSYWTHEPRQFAEAIGKHGFRIVKSGVCFRGYSDIVVAERN